MGFCRSKGGDDERVVGNSSLTGLWKVSPSSGSNGPGMSPNRQVFAQDCSEEELRAVWAYSYLRATMGSTFMARRAGM